MDYFHKISLLREKMRQNGFDAYVVYAFDPHHSIAIADHWKTVQWLTGFSGWVCLLVVTMHEEAFWTDGRYVQQAKKQLANTGINQFCISDPCTINYIDWLTSKLPPQSCVGFDGRIVTVAESKNFIKALNSHNIKYNFEKDLIGEIWNERPDIATTPLFELELKYSGKSRKEKLAQVRNKMQARKADFYLMSGLDDIAWLTNLRGGDNALYPIFHAYMVINKEKAFLFINVKKVNCKLRQSLLSDNIEVKSIEAISSFLIDLPDKSTVYFDPYKTGMILQKKLSKNVFTLEGIDIVTGLKCCKNDVEQKNIRLANIEESVSVTRLIKFIKNNIGKMVLSEYLIGQWINAEREKFTEFLMPANIPIVGCKGNAVQLHYRPTREKSEDLPSYGFVLFDLCAHYLLGSTDITRTIALGPLTEQMRWDYTFTLKTHIHLATQKFLYGTTGPVLDGVIKSFHWNQGLNYSAGTGHGMGYCMFIQEGPCKIALDASPYFNYMFESPIEPGMLFSNEPGIYREGSHAIRLENSIIAKDSVSNNYGRFLEFETVTFIPFDSQAVDASMLNDEELQWYNDYQEKCYELIHSFFDEEEQKWLRNETRPISR